MFKDSFIFLKMKNLFLLLTLTWSILYLSSCEDGTTSVESGTKPTEVDSTQNHFEVFCSWCNAGIEKDIKSIVVRIGELNGKQVLGYGPNSGGPLMQQGIENPYNGLQFCCLRCLYDYSKSDLSVKGINLINGYRIESDGFWGDPLYGTNVPDPSELGSGHGTVVNLDE